MLTEPSVPNPEFLIKSIAEQGYSLETSIADLLDNSISAGAHKIEVLIDTHEKPLMLFIADDGHGMSEEELRKNMGFPSSSMEAPRNTDDLGRFGLGLKTASFAQTRKFTVISRRAGDKKYSARTWDVNHLKTAPGWEIIVNKEDEINECLTRYSELSGGFLNSFPGFDANTIVVWYGLYKFEDNIAPENQADILQKELNETTKEYLQLIFHRFMEQKDALQIRLNNEQLIPFNPFPASARSVAVQQKMLMGNRLSLEGFVLPNRSIAESKGVSEWTLSHKSLMDMEGMYIYRADRIIVFGGWNAVIKKSPRLQLARLRVEIGNGIDQLFHLNVAKSSITIPFGERIAFIRYVSALKTEAEKEYHNYETRAARLRSPVKNIFVKVPTSNGMTLEIDDTFPLLKSFMNTLNEDQIKQLRIIFKMITTSVNKIKKVHSDENFLQLTDKQGISEDDLKKALGLLLENGFSKSDILNEIIPTMGISDQSLPLSVLNLLK
jgi:hypothetical protein